MLLDTYLVQGGVAGISSSVGGKFTYIFIISQKGDVALNLFIYFISLFCFLFVRQAKSISVWLDK